MTRTTITLDNELREEVRREAARRNASFRETLNDLLRLGIQHARNATSAKAVHMFPARKMKLRPGLSYESTSSLLEAIEETRKR